jgi:uncharacterized protein (TIGR02453 family)
MARNTPAETAAPPFTGFGPAALPFLEGLAANQTRDWFLANKPIYERDLRGPLGSLVESLAFAFAAHDIPLTGDARRSLFRMHRDVRFSKDKSRYKTNAGAVLTRDGLKNSNGLLYIQIGGEGGSFMAAGFYHAEPDDLGTLRRAIAEHAERWLALEVGLGDAGLALGGGDAMTRLPRGFEDHAGSPVAPSLKLRNFVVRRPIAAKRLHDPGLVDDIVEFTSAALPVLRFGWSALDKARGHALAVG